LDPNFKVVYAKQRWGSDTFQAGLTTLETVVSSMVDTTLAIADRDD
jgi:hypothetical protein